VNLSAHLGFTIVSSALVLAICVSQLWARSTETGSGPDRAAASASAPQLSVATPHMKIVTLQPPSRSAASSSAPQTADAESEIQEVMVRAQRLKPSIPITERRRFYIESRSSGDSNDSLLLYENGRVCADKSLSVPNRLTSCDMNIWMMKHGASMEDSDRAKAYVARGEVLQLSGDHAAAIQDFKDAVKLDPTSPRPWVGLGNVYSALSDYSHAFENYDRAMSLAPDDPVVNDNRGTALESLGRHEEAIAAFSRAILRDPHDTSALSNRAMAYLAVKRQDLAIADLNEVIRAAPSNALNYYDRGTAYELNGEIDSAESDYREVVSRLPSFAPALAALGRLDSKHNPDLALAELGTAIRLDPKSPAIRTRAALYLSLQQPERALPDLDQAIANDATDDIAWANRGVAKSKLGDLAGAVADCTRAIELAPTVANRVNRGNAYATLHRNNDALTDFDMALQAEPHNLPALLGRGNANYASKRLTASLEDYTHIIEADPNNAMAYFRRGNIQLDLKEFASAFGDFSKSLQLDPNQAVVLLNRSIAAARLGRRGDAAKDQRQALALDPEILEDKR
jgi:tetratricopeptide (TPR) repeat protein